MIYRIKRLEEELLIDFSNSGTRLQLLISYEIYDSFNSVHPAEGETTGLVQSNR
jgi:hypothetical protein